MLERKPVNFKRVNLEDVPEKTLKKMNRGLKFFSFLPSILVSKQIVITLQDWGRVYVFILEKTHSSDKHNIVAKDVTNRFGSVNIEISYESSQNINFIESNKKVYKYEIVNFEYSSEIQINVKTKN